MENLFKSSKPLQENFGSESFKRMPFVSFFLYILMAFFVLAAFAELCLTFGLHDVNWINSKRIIYINFAYIVFIFGIGCGYLIDSIKKLNINIAVIEPSIYFFNLLIK